MRDLTGKTAFVTGGASGIGLALARAFAAAGMRVMLADIEATVLERALAELRADGHTAESVLCDVADAASVERAAAAAVAAFGTVHIVCNNAGVGGARAPGIALEDWRWVVDVNLMGVMHGVRAFLPHMIAHGEGGHFVNTASMAGMIGGALGFSPYTASKFAVVGMSEGLAVQLARTGVQGIGVTILCPGWISTRITDSERNRPARYGPPSAAPATPLAEKMAELVRTGMAPGELARRALAAIRAGELYVFTHPDMKAALAERFAGILAAYDKA